MDLTGLTTLFSALMAAAASNNGGLAVAFLLISGLAWKLRQCEKKHDITLNQNARLTAAYMEMAGAVNVLSGNRIVDVNNLQDVLSGKQAVRYNVPPAGDRG